ncbi:unnamed protein product [Allacma fusca]|uniref:Uncharacterized protein n=1 Tax=Allacma fusca TaxID=39272 RepID=A0A8J2JDS1_9HEXA|nr:unnamed protein product [Allacma fusca]
MAATQENKDAGYKRKQVTVGLLFSEILCSGLLRSIPLEPLGKVISTLRVVHDGHYDTSSIDLSNFLQLSSHH